MRRLSWAIVTGLTLLLLAACGRHLAGLGAAGSPAPASTTSQVPETAPAGTIAANRPAAVTSTPAASTRGTSPSDLSAVSSDLTRAGDAAGVANQHLSSGAAAASQSDNP